MQTMPTEKPGTASSPLNQDLDAPIKWVTEEEAESFNKMLYKNFVRKKELNAGDNKKFFYRITGLCPFVPLHRNGREVLAAANQNLVEFTVNRYYRDKMEKVRRREAGQEIEEEVNKMVSRYEYDSAGGTWNTVDRDTDMKIEAREFLNLFERDRE